MNWEGSSRLLGSSNEEMDTALVAYFNSLYLKGKLPHEGDYTLAAIAFHQPTFTKMLHVKLPRATKCMKGLEKALPAYVGKSRKPGHCGAAWPFS